MSRWSEQMKARMLDMFSGAESGRPPWIDAIEGGDDAGFFGPGSAAWIVHGGMPTLVAGIRALLMQTLHPGAMAGVHDWSRYKQDPLGRLSGTVRWLVTTTFADTGLARRESERVARFHSRVAGTYTDGSGSERAYFAGDPELLRWVHLAFTDSFLACQQRWGGAIPGGGDAYVREWAQAGELVGVQSPPASVAEMRGELETLRATGVLRRDERVEQAVRFIRNPPLDKRMMPAYRILFAGAVATIPPEFRRLLGLRRSPVPAVLGTRIALAAAGTLLGAPSHAEKAARRRIARLRGAAVEPSV
ncbi:oxygenase MpaB family protein [Lysobacter korlensis]|uniref:Oxygenase MpaB family protein n=1 Tax=Lysobacter korlensis TaxID=553636 RepID=A0ABV6RVF4_9GAMM